MSNGESLEQPAAWERMDSATENLRTALADRLIIADEDPRATDRRANLVNRIYVIVVVFGLLIALMYAGLFVIFLQVQHLDAAVASAQATADDTQRETLVNRESGVKNRAVNCQILVSLGEALPPQCLEPSVVALYDPEAVPTAGADSPGQRANRELLCGLYRQLDFVRPELCLG